MKTLNLLNIYNKLNIFPLKILSLFNTALCKKTIKIIYAAICFINRDYKDQSCNNHYA